METKQALRWFMVQSVPKEYVFFPDERPGEITAPVCSGCPVIDLGNLAVSPEQKDMIIREIMNASQEFGFFQVINHGISENLMNEAMSVFKDFFDMPEEEKGRAYAGRFNYVEEDVCLWRENLKHPCHPLHECIQSWPEKPTRYRDIVGKYSVLARKLSLGILELISEGLGLGKGYFGDELTKVQMLSVNYYPPCPDPSLTMGIPAHCDPNLITALQSNVQGLQILKDGNWMFVEPLPNAFVINIGYQLQIISNGKLKSAEHRAVTNLKDPRTSIVTLINPSFEAMIEPAKALIINACNPPLYRAFLYKEFLNSYKAKKGDPKTVLEDYTM